MKLNKVVICCFKRDLYLLRTCVASIHYWNPEAEIYLLKDEGRGKFSTKEIERGFSAKIFHYENDLKGWGWGKIEICLTKRKERFLVLDTDIILLGNIFEYLNQFDEDFVVTGVNNLLPDSANMKTNYLNVKEVMRMDPQYTFPGFGFNTGQMVVTGGILNKTDFENVMEFGKQIKNKYPNVLAYTDQGVLNYVLVKQSTNKNITLRYADFWIWPGLPEAESFKLEDIKQKKALPCVLHWAGIKPIDFRRLKRYDLFDFFEKEYYKKIKFGELKRFFRRSVLISYLNFKILTYKLRGLNYPK